MKDPYRYFAGIYQHVFDSMNMGLRMVGMKMCNPTEGMRILDVGCGTASYLELFQRHGCTLVGLDRSPAMLAIAQQRLQAAAQLDLGDATVMPFAGNSFDLAISMLSLHEMAPDTRSSVLGEMERVTRENGRILLIDFHPGPYQPLQGWISKVVIFFSELSAGWEHFRNHRKFLSAGGLSALLVQHNLMVEKQKVLGGGTFAIYLLSKKPEQP